jgi:AcrR family transcriptional regulator
MLGYSLMNKSQKLYGDYNMDRRQRKTREAIFKAFTELLSKKIFDQITVGEIIESADIGRATFYSHFETKDYLLKEFCEELFCHIFDTENEGEHDHRHIFECDGSDSVFLHLIKHLQKNDNNILTLLSSHNNELFLRYFRNNLETLIESHLDLFESQTHKNVPKAFLKNYVTSTFVETIRWWINNGMNESPEVITEYFFAVI